ncbi:SGNH/GDSL hydrolase family protein [Deinococcus sedimenti]|uniref:SGNH hydrolase-type esterase domain-containing protein n=1 Tax=Deinococcus sedimenti TaxID=1867090 RepID=A0ABQ2S9B9_9DEIO|nr:SGNH/GDSL hydrolase family protein [Deinococcus sedimenti]GGS09830.1 hypothetical protein GCM10008960_40090 [Deinococcus sedimenti]
MTNPVKKRVVTLDDLNVLNQNAAYARQKGEVADAAATRATTAAEQAEQAAGALPSLTEAATLLGNAREAAGYVAPLAAAKQQADQNHVRATSDHQQVNSALLGLTATTEELRGVAATYSLGRAPQAGDPAGTYRWVDGDGNVVDTAWDGAAATGQTLALTTTAQATVIDERARSQGLYARAISGMLSRPVRTPQRVLFIGDSITEGWDQLDGRDAYAAQLAAALRLLNPAVVIANYALGGRGLSHYNDPNYKGQAAEPANIGTGFGPSWNFARPWVVVGKSWRDHARDFAPDLTVVAFGMNEAGGAGSDATHAANLQAALDDTATWPTPPTAVVVPTFLPTPYLDRYGQRQDVTQAVARATREVGRTRGLYVADANRLDGLLRRGVDDVARAARTEADWEGWPDVWGAGAGTWVHAGDTLTPGSGVSGFAERTEAPFYNGSISFNVRPADPGDKLWVGYRHSDSLGEMIVLIHPTGGSFGSGAIEVYTAPGALLTQQSGLNIPVGAETPVRIVADGSWHEVWVAGVRALRIQTYRNLHDGTVRMGLDAPGRMTMKHLRLTYLDALTAGPMYTEDELLGVWPNGESDSGNAINHPTGEGHALILTPAFRGLLGAVVPDATGGGGGGGGELVTTPARLAGVLPAGANAEVWADELDSGLSAYNTAGTVTGGGGTVTVGNPGSTAEASSFMLHKTRTLPRDGSLFAEVRVTLNGQSEYVRSGLILSTSNSVLNGYFIVFEGSAVGGVGQAVRILRLTNGALGSLNPDRFAAFAHTTNAPYTLSVRPTAANLEVYVDGVKLLDIPDGTFAGPYYVGYAHSTPGGATTFGTVDRFDLTAALAGAGPLPLALTGVLPDDLLIGWQDAGRAGLLHALFPGVTASVAGTLGRAVTYQSAQGTLRLVPGLEWPPAGAGLARGATLTLTEGLRAAGRVVGFAERGQDPQMQAWNYTHQGEPLGITAVNPATGEVAMTCQNVAPWGFAWGSRMKFDPRFDFTFSADVKTEILSGTHSFGALVAFCSEYNYTGLLQAKDISTSAQPGVLHHETYGDEAGALYQNVPGVVNQNEYHRLRLAYVAATQSMRYYVDDVLVATKTWAAQGAVCIWICSVSNTNNTADGVCRITYRNVVGVGTPVQGAVGIDSLVQEVTRAAGQAVDKEATSGTGRDFITGAGTAVSRVITPINPGDGWRELVVGGTGLLKVRVATPDGTVLPDGVLAGNAAGFGPGAVVSLAGVPVDAYPALTLRATLAAGDKLYELRIR